MALALMTGPLAAQTAEPTTAPPTERLPGGSTALRETFDDWLVNCAAVEGKRRCVIAQQQHSQQTRQLVLAVELAPAADGRLQGTLVLPFGLALAEGASLQVDDQTPGAPLPFRTCLPVGCIVDLMFDDAEQSMLKSGTALKIAAKADGGEDVPLSISLKGFTAALDRLREILK